MISAFEKREDAKENKRPILKLRVFCLVVIALNLTIVTFLGYFAYRSGQLDGLVSEDKNFLSYLQDLPQIWISGFKFHGIKFLFNLFCALAPLFGPALVTYSSHWKFGAITSASLATFAIFFAAIYLTGGSVLLIGILFWMFGTICLLVGCFRILNLIISSTSTRKATGS